MDAYQVLGIEHGADAARAKKAYHALAKEWHPDRHRGLPTENEAHERMAQINRAYAEVKNGVSARRVQTASQRERPREPVKAWAAQDERLIRQARSLISQAKFGEAMAALRQCKLRSAEWFEMMGRCQAETGDIQGAEDSFRWAARKTRNETRRRKKNVSWWRKAVRWIRSLLKSA